MAAPQRKPADVLKEARDRKFAEWFQDRRWRVMDEVTGERDTTVVVPDGSEVAIIVKYSAGHFTIPAPAKFYTPLGRPGRVGIMVAEIDAMGQDTGVTASFGATSLAKAQEAYGLIVGL
jgi:hypothetical protein